MSKKQNKVAALPLRPKSLMQTIRKRAENKDNVLFSEHAFDRSDLRVITQEDVYRVLRLGEIISDPIPGKNEGEWKATVEFRPKGSRTVGVATVVSGHDEKIFVTTVLWRDA